MVTIYCECVSTELNSISVTINNFLNYYCTCASMSLHHDLINNSKIKNYDIKVQECFLKFMVWDNNF